MKIKKILIVPAQRIVIPDGSLFKKLSWMAKYALKIDALLYEGELQFYADIPKILGKENTFILGSYKPYLLSKKVPSDCPYPSCHGTPSATSIDIKQIKEIIKQVDAVLISLRAGEHIKLVIQEARANNIPIAMLDFPDHESIYATPDKKKEIFRGYLAGEDFDIFFKKDLPLGFKNESIFPLTPLPVRPESYHYEAVIKDKTIFYSGRPRPILCQADRIDTVSLIKENFLDTLIIEHDSRSTFMTHNEYCQNLSRSRMALSPSGRSWDSFRHCEVGLSPLTALIAPKPYIETVGPYLQDGVNAILYDTELRTDGKYHLTDPQSLVDKINFYLNNPTECDKIAKKWKEDVLSGHTILARSHYIINCLEKVL